MTIISELGRKYIKIFYIKKRNAYHLGRHPFTKLKNTKLLIASAANGT